VIWLAWYYKYPEGHHEAEAWIDVEEGIRAALKSVAMAYSWNAAFPSLPWINGRDLAGLVLQVPRGSSRLRVGDVVLVPSTDYRDIRTPKASTAATNATPTEAEAWIDVEEGIRAALKSVNRLLYHHTNPRS
jgi:hypothetical protein